MEIVRGVLRRRARTAVSLAGIMLGVVVLTLTAATSEHFTEQQAGEVALERSSVQVTDDAATYAGLVSLARVDPVSRVPGVAVAMAEIRLLARPGTASPVPFGLPDTVGYVDVREQMYSPIRTVLASGRQLLPNHQGEVVLGSAMAGEFHLSVGGRIALPVRPPNANADFVNHQFVVVGVLRPTHTLPDTMASISLLDAQTLLQESLPAAFRDRVDPTTLATGITVYGKPGTNLDTLADRIVAAVPGVAAARPSDAVRAVDTGGQLGAIAALAGAIGLGFGGVLLGAAMLTAVVEREREIGLKMLLGARPWHVAAEQAVEAAALALLAGAVGLAIGAGTAAVLNLAGGSIGLDVFVVTGGLVQLALALSLALGLAAGALPAFRAARLDPDTVLRAR